VVLVVVGAVGALVLVLWLSRAAAIREANGLRWQVATLTERAAAVTSERDAAMKKIDENNRAIAALAEEADRERRAADTAVAAAARMAAERRRKAQATAPGVAGMNEFVREVL